MDLRSLIDSLGADERRVLSALQGLGGEPDVSDLSRHLGLDQAAVMRAALALADRNLINIRELKRTVVTLTEEGRDCAARGLPERRALRALTGRDQVPVGEAAELAGLQARQVEISLGWLKRKGWARLTRRADAVYLSLTGDGEAALGRKYPDEMLLERLAEVGSAVAEELPNEMMGAVDVLEKRGLIEVKRKARRKFALTDLGAEVLAVGVEPVEEVSELTRELLVSGRWREVRLRRYDVTAPGAPIYPGKLHPQQQVIDELREILIGMGFAEVKANIVESEFWNFDALFQAQDHPAREIFDSFSLSKPERTRLPPPSLLKRVAEAHERGVAGSTGWGCKFSPEVSGRPVLCSQTTAATVRYLALNPEPPVKVFCIDRVYRRERVDYKHLAEFYQAEGIVMDRGLTMRDMPGYLKQIVAGLGFDKIRFRPSYFPYTEPSVEAHVYHEGKREWLEVLGAGMFRPELLLPLGIRYPVLAWGIGLSRLVMLKLGVEDIREIFSNDIQWISSFVYP